MTVSRSYVLILRTMLHSTSSSVRRTFTLAHKPNNRTTLVQESMWFIFLLIFGIIGLYKNAARDWSVGKRNVPFEESGMRTTERKTPFTLHVTSKISERNLLQKRGATPICKNLISRNLLKLAQQSFSKRFPLQSSTNFLSVVCIFGCKFIRVAVGDHSEPHSLEKT